MKNIGEPNSLEFAHRIRILRLEKDLKQKQAASILGISQSALANYEKGIRFPDQEILKRLSAVYKISLDFLLGNELVLSEPSSYLNVNQLQNIETLKADYTEMVLAGQREEALFLLLRALKTGVKLEVLFMNILDPILKEAGNQWEKGFIDVAEEHLLTQEISRTIQILTFTAAKNSRQKKSCVCIAAGGELHGLGLQMIASMLTIRGWTVWHLGTNTPINEAVQFCRTKGVRLIAVSATMTYHLDSIKNLIYANKVRPEKPVPKILVGGLAFAAAPGLWKEIGADGYAPDLLTALEEAEKLWER